MLYPKRIISNKRNNPEIVSNEYNKCHDQNNIKYCFCGFVALRIERNKIK